MGTPQPIPGEKVTKWGYTFSWTDRHLSREEIEPLRQQYDTLGAQALDRLQAIRAASYSGKEGKESQAVSTAQRDLYALLRDNQSKDETLSQLWNEVHTVPDWVDWAQLARGQGVFYRYAIANIVGFALQGFVAENSAAPGVVEVLVRTGGFSTRTLLNRLLETFQWLIQVTHDLCVIQPGGEAHVATIRVRLLHASVRQRILQLCERKPGYFDTGTYGVPVNTLDSIHSISTFCCNPMWLQLPKFGIRPSKQEVEDYIALFRYLGYLLGTPTGYFDSMERAKTTMESMLAHELRTTETSRTVAYNFVECVGNLPLPYYVSKRFIEAGSRWINGHELCDELELGRPGILHYLAFGGHCVLVTVLAWMQWIAPVLDEIVVQAFKTAMYNGVVMRKRTRFDFKYIPQMGKNTGKEKYREHTGQGLGYADIQVHSLCPDMGLFELVFIVILLVPAMLAAVVALWGYRSLGNMS